MAALWQDGLERRRPSLRGLVVRAGLPALALLLAAGTAWLLHQVSREPARRADTLAHRPDYYLHRFTRTATDDSGALSDRLSAERMVHFADDESTELVRPQFEFYNGSEQPWRVVAEQGWVSGDGEVVLLSGAVTAWRDGPWGEHEVELRTRDLRVLPKAKYAETDAPATITDPSTVVAATGLKADFGLNKLELMKDVRTRYESLAR